RLSGHEIGLPTVATRCINCHAASGTAAGGSAPDGPARGGLAAARPYASPLSAEWLTLPRSRRGGPPSDYDLGRLCRLLRTGVDPAQVVISTVMPRYDATDAQCAALWQYL